MSRPPRVLIVDDLPENRDILGGLLEPEGYVVETARDGQEAVEKALADPPDLILMDVSLGGPLDGLEATRRLRADPAFDRTPIVALTAHAMPGDRERVLAAGCDEHWTKPITDLLAFREMVARVALEGRVNGRQ